MCKFYQVFIYALLTQALLVNVAEPQDLVFSDSFELCHPIDTVLWDGGGDGASWADALNWKGDTLPVDGDSVSIRTGSADTIIYDNSLDTTRIICLDSSESITVTGGVLELDGNGWVRSNVTVTGGTLTVSGNLKISGTLEQSSGIMAGFGMVTVGDVFTWSGGTQKESGETVADGGLILSGTVRNLDARTLTLNAPSSFTGGELRLWNGATINNNALFDIKTDDNLRFLTGSNSTFNNNDSVIKSAGAGETAIQANFNNSGTVTISTGELHLGRTGATGSSTGNFDVASGALLGISGNNSLSGEISGDGGLDCHVGGTTTVSNIYTLSGPLTVGGVALTFDIPVTIGGDVTVTNGTLTFTSAPTAINADVVMSNGTLTTSVAVQVSGSWTQSNGTLAGTGKVTVAGLMTWSGGTQKESGETVADGGLILSGTVRNLDARTLTLNAPSSFTGGELRLWNGATINNNALFDIKTDDNLRFLTGSNSTFNNNDSVIKSAGAGETAIQANFNNSGTVTISTGELHVGRTGATGSSTGNFDVASGALLGISGNNSLSGEISGDGGLDCHIGGTTTVSNIYTLSGPLSVGGVALTFDIPVTITGDVTVTNGTLAFTTAPTSIDADVVMTNGTLTTPVALPVSGSWTQSNGTLAGTGKVTVAGLMTWSGGTQKESGETVADGGLMLSGTVRNLDARTLTLNAPSSFTGGELRLWNGATINNNALFDIKTDDNLRFLTGSNSTFNNNDSVIKSAGAGETAIQANFNNSGTVTISTGELHVGRTGATGSSTGNFDVASGALLGISGNNSLSGEISGDGGLDCHVGGTTTVSNIYTLSGPLTVGGVALTFDIPVTIGGDVTVTNGTLTFTSAPTAINADVVMSNGTLTTSVAVSVSGSWTQSNGTLAGTGKVTVAGLMTWSGGTQKESGETVADGGLMLSGTVRNLDARTLTLNAPSSFTGGELRLWNGATINNNALFDIKTDDNLRFLTGSNSTFNNNDSVIKSAGAGETAIQANFNNSGTVTISTGELHLGRTGATGSSTGNFDVASGALLGISGNNSLSGEISGDGGLDCHVGGTTTVSNIYTLSGPLTVGGVALTFDIPVTIGGDVTVTNGTLTFTSAPTAINADVVMSNGTLTTSVAVSVSGSWTQSNGTLAGTGKVTVAGLMTWSGGTQKESGETVADGGLMLSGTVRNLDARTLTLNAPSSFTGGELRLWNGATINNNALFDIKTDDNLRFLTGSNSTFNNNDSVIKSAGAGETAIQANFNNSGTVTVDTGEISFSRTFTQDASGTLDVHILGPADFDVFAVTQSATLDGTVNIIRDGYAPGTGTAFDIMTCNTCSGAFATVNGNGVTFTQTVAADKVTLTAD